MEINHSGSFGENNVAEISLPATTYEHEDAPDKARITDEHIIYSSEILSCELDYLPQFISPDANLYELNHLVHKWQVIIQSKAVKYFCQSKLIEQQKMSKEHSYDMDNEFTVIVVSGLIIPFHYVSEQLK